MEVRGRIVEAEPMAELLLGLDDLVVLRHGKDNQWQIVASDLAVIADWDSAKTQIGVLDGVAYLFGIRNEALQHCRLHKGKCTAEETLPIENVTKLQVLMVNRELRVIVAVCEDISEAISKGGEDVEHVFYRMGWRGKEEWVFSDPLRKDSARKLVGFPERVIFAVFGQNIMVFERRSEREVRLGQYDSTGELRESLERPIAAIEEESIYFLEWMFGTKVITVLMLVIVIFVFWRREEAFIGTGILPDYIQLASIWRRALAFILDILLVSLVANFIWEMIPSALYSELPQSMEEVDLFLEQIKKGYVEPRILKAIAVVSLINYLFFILYLTFCEVVFSTTLGKRAFKLMVVNIKGNRMSMRQALVRNMLRLLDFYPHPQFYLMTLVLVLITRCRQRSGDLIARTIVVVKTQELLDQWEHGISAGEAEGIKEKTDMNN